MQILHKMMYFRQLMMNQEKEIRGNNYVYIHTPSSVIITC